MPDRPQRELRELTRYRTQLIRERASEVNRMQKTLEGANIKLASVATDITGVSGRQILSALIGGETDTQLMAQLAKGRMREKIPQLEAALKGSFGGHQRFMLAHQLAHIDFLDASIEELNTEIEERMAPFEWALDLLTTIRGVGQRTAEVIIAEIGVDMERFPTSRHLASWAGMCPGNNESAGKRKSGRTRKGNVWLRTALVEAAQAAGRCKGSKEGYLSAQYRRIARQGGSNKAAVAVGHSILVIAYEMLKHQTTYNDLGANYFDERDRQAKERRLIYSLERLGYKVSLEPVPQLPDPIIFRAGSIKSFISSGGAKRKKTTGDGKYPSPVVLGRILYSGTGVPNFLGYLIAELCEVVLEPLCQVAGRFVIGSRVGPGGLGR